MKRPLGFILFILLSAACGNVLAQQQPLYSQYTLDKYLYNPAIAGADGYTTVNLLARQEEEGFTDPPTTFVLSGQTRILEDSYISKLLNIKKNDKKASRAGRVGIGGCIFSDRNGAISKTGVQLTYAYHITFSNKGQLSMGLSLSAYQFKLNDANAVILDPTDPLLNSTKRTFFIPDANAGVFYLTDSYYAGFSAANLMGSVIKIGKDSYQDYRSPRNYYFLAGYKWYPFDKIKIEPSMMMQTMQRDVVVDFNTTATYDGNYWLGFSYRTNKTVIVTAGVTVKNIFLGYSYDATLSTIRNYTSGAHEFILGMRFGDNDTRRARWLHKDVKNFETN